MPYSPKYHKQDVPENNRAPGDRGYGSAWRKRRLQKLAVDPVCEDCGSRFATCVDHIDNNRANVKWSNLKSLCDSCHSRKTVRYDGGLGNPVSRIQIDP